VSAPRGPWSEHLAASSPRLRLLATDRRAGKSTQAVAWVSHGVPTAGYPGWSRVLAVSHATGFQLLRAEWWGRLADFDHRVYALCDWASAHGVVPATEVCVDDLEEAMARYTVGRLPGRVVAATVTAQVWERQVFREDPRPRWS
jgi:hypothetical protein